MKVIVTHYFPDWDAIASVWLIKKYFSGWEEAVVEFVPHGSRLRLNGEVEAVEDKSDDAVSAVIERDAQKDMMHVDTGLGPLDHHDSEDMTVSAASKCLAFVKEHNDLFTSSEDKWRVHTQALERMVVYVSALDHFQEVFWPEAKDDRYDFSLWGVLTGYKTQVQGDNEKIMAFGLGILDAVFHRMEEKIWSEREIQRKGKEFTTKFGKGLAIESIDDDLVKQAQKMGYVIVVRKDPRKGYVRIKAVPLPGPQAHVDHTEWEKTKDMDLTVLYERLKKIDSRASWYLHISKRMILNSANKETKAVPTTLPLAQVVALILELYSV